MNNEKQMTQMQLRPQKTDFFQMGMDSYNENWSHEKIVKAAIKAYAEGDENAMDAMVSGRIEAAARALEANEQHPGAGGTD